MHVLEGNTCNNFISIVCETPVVCIPQCVKDNLLRMIKLRKRKEEKEKKRRIEHKKHRAEAQKKRYDQFLP